jgi:hypothetical protein
MHVGISYKFKTIYQKLNICEWILLVSMIVIHL